jgi:hypothetical protein
MTVLEFRVEERPVAPGQHSWVAIDLSSGVEIALPQGGNKTAAGDFVGRYPEVEAHILACYNLVVPLTYDSRIDELTTTSDGASTWFFHRSTATVRVYDIARTVWRVEFGKA